MRNKLLIFSISLLMGLLVSCKNGGGVPNPAPAVYYWKTTFELSEAQQEWLAQENVQKIYLRLFDIIPTAEGPIPNATITFSDTLPSGCTIIPTIFIDYTLFRSPVAIEELAEKTLARIAKMAATHDFSYTEVQFDCDWTATTQDRYFDFLRAAHRLDSTLTLSSTIRLHQLSLPAPPCDYGVLMLYNTGDFRQANGQRNPILDAEDVKPYIKNLSSYQLPLCAAYPNFDWQLLFHEGQFAGMLYQEDLTDETTYLPVDATTYRVVTPRNIPIPNEMHYLHLAPGDEVRHWQSDPKQIAQVRKMVEAHHRHIHDQVVNYHLSSIE